MLCVMILYAAAKDRIASKKIQNGLNSACLSRPFLVPWTVAMNIELRYLHFFDLL